MSEPEATPPAKVVARRTLLPKIIVVVCMVLLVAMAGLFAAMRFGVLLPQARVFIEARTDGLKVGRLGKLKMEGLAGDIWRDFTIRRLTIRDDKGVWLEANNLHLSWRYEALLRRRFHAEALEAESLRVLRRPEMGPKGKSSGMPLSFQIDRAHTQVETLPAFSQERGLFDLNLALALERRGGQRGSLRAASLLHLGDKLDLAFDISQNRPLLFRLDASEAQGGALAGSLGLSPDVPFLLQATADGRMSSGRFNAVAASGDVQPLTASGAWTKEGGDARGRLLLSASSLTRPWAAKVGPEAAFNITGRKAQNGFYTLDGAVEAENLVLKLSGRGDIGQRKVSPEGVALDLSTPGLGRLTGMQAGPARVDGVVRQISDGWTFAGKAALSRVAIGGYTLAEIGGPIEATSRKGDLGLKVRASGRGGRGEGWANALLGASPNAAFEGQRLSDGRLALKSLDVNGSGLKVAASGGRSLTGALSFKGRAELSRLASVRPGGAGSATAVWEASQAGAERPWLLDVRVDGRSFATGYAELDRLLGARPRLAAKGSVQGRRVALSRATLDGAEIKASSAGLLADDGVLKFKLDWSANGPFRAGPVEIQGKASGDGAITGRLSAPRIDMMADVEAVDLPRLPLKDAKVTLSFVRQDNGSSGIVAVEAASEYGPAKARSDFAFPEGGVDLTGLAIDAGGLKASGSASLRRGAPSGADLQLAVTQGAFLQTGDVVGRVRIVDTPAGATANLSLTAKDVRPQGSTLQIASGSLTANGPLSQLPYAINAQGFSGRTAWRAQGQGTLREERPGYQLAFNGAARYGSRELRTAEAALLRFGGEAQTARLRLLAEDGGRIEFDGRLQGEDASVQARTTGLGMTVLDQDLDGQVNATLSLQGRGDQLTGTLEARLAGARGKGAPAASGIDGVVRARLDDSVLNIEAQVGNQEGLTSSAVLRLPTEASAKPLRLAIARRQPMQGRFTARGEIRPLWDLVVGGERSLAGNVDTEATLAGTLADPQISGRFALQNGQFDDGATGLSLRQMVVNATFARTGVDISQAQAADGHGGQLSGSGRISLLRDGVSTFKLDLRRFRLIDNDQARASASGEATISRAADGKVTLAGGFRIDEAEISPDLPIPSGVVPMDVVERNRPPDLAPIAPTAARTGGASWALDVRLRAPDKIFLRGRGLDLELSLDARVTGTTSAPNLSGEARIVRGDYDFAGKRFEFDEDSVVYLSTRPEAIRLQLSATREDPSLTAVVRIQGTAARPEITLTSTPTLPNDEVLSQVLFGRSASQLSALEAAQLASAISAMSGGGGFDVIGNLRNFAGLDRLSFGGGDASGMTVAGGKYLTDDVYLEVIGGGREAGAAQVEWRVKRNFSIISRLANQGGARLAIRWRRDY